MTRRRLLIALAVVVGGVAVLYGAVWFYAAVINDAPDALDADDLGCLGCDHHNGGGGGR